uniref:Integrase catalytic domain-containing protein n=1 Tax=Physcomitrium patens TaxID=3218 RepID=A0A2K1JZZ6_PHYPA|nr:hypothetical protein PHYPA_014219 [Physcomitrium patens]
MVVERSKKLKTLYMTNEGMDTMNGFIERMNKTLNEHIWSMKIHSTLPKHFWTNTINIITYLID